MTTTTSFDAYLERVSQGEPLPADALHTFATGPDILPLGMLADAWRARLHGPRATFLRVASLPWDAIDAAAVPPGAREVRLTGAPDALDAAVAAVRAAAAVSAGRAVSAFAWPDVMRWAAAASEPAGLVLTRLREAGLDEVAGLGIDDVPDVTAMIETLAGAGFTSVRLQVGQPGAADRLALWAEVDAAHRRFGCVAAISPLPSAQRFQRPTTGYDDVKMLASARLAAPHVPHVQVDWVKYGPKLAQVALTFGADDLDNVSGFDDMGEGRRRAPLEEIRRNIQAAGLEAVERDSRFGALAG
jgi:2-iminoacetate synthase ThiH